MNCVSSARRWKVLVLVATSTDQEEIAEMERRIVIAALIGWVTLWGCAARPHLQATWYLEPASERGAPPELFVSIANVGSERVDAATVRFVGNEGWRYTLPALDPGRVAVIPLGSFDCAIP